MPMPPPFTRSPYGALANFGGNDDNVIHPDQSLAARGIEVAPRDFSLPNQGDQIDRPPSSGGRARELKISDTPPMLARAAELFRRGVLSQEQYDALLTKYGQPGATPGQPPAPM